jgi:hypothetical protein
MKSLPNLTWLAAAAHCCCHPQRWRRSRAQYESLVAAHAKTNNVPEALVHRVIVRESKYHPNLVGRGGTIGLMQIKLATARGLGYTGDAAGLRDPDAIFPGASNISPAPIAPPTRDHGRAMRYYASGIITLQSASGSSSPCRSRPCSRVAGRRKSSPSRSKRQEHLPTQTRCRPQIAKYRTPRAGAALRQGITAVQFPQSRVDTGPNRLH